MSVIAFPAFPKFAGGTLPAKTAEKQYQKQVEANDARDRRTEQEKAEDTYEAFLDAQAKEEARLAALRTKDNQTHDVDPAALSKKKKRALEKTRKKMGLDVTV